MSQQASEMNTLELRAQRRGRLTAAAIMLVIFLPMAIAYGVFYTGIGMPANTVNKGDLLTPAQAAGEFDLRDFDGAVWDPGEHKRKWRWLIPGDAQCTGYCRENLYLTRQVHIRLGEKAARVERIYLLLDEQMDATTRDFLATEHPYLQVIKADPERLQAAATAAGVSGNPVADGRYFLMDQNGFVMMSYTPTHTGQQLLDDIKRMLKYSYEE